MPTKLFTPGNNLWMLRPYDKGTAPIFATAEELYDRCVEYFEWAVDNPIQTEEIGWYQGEAYRETIDHPRAFTIAGLCAHAGIQRQLWYDWRKKENWNN